MKKATYAIAILFLGFIFLITQQTMAQESTQNIKKSGEQAKEKENNKKSTLTWDKSKHVFGSIEHKKPVTAEFTFTNNGTMPIAITKVGTTCGCTSPSYTKEPIKAGADGVLKLAFDAVSPGFFKKAAKVHFSDGSSKELEIEGKVVVRMSDIK